MGCVVGRASAGKGILGVMKRKENARRFEGKVKGVDYL